MLVEDTLLLGLWVQQVRDELLERRRDPGGERVRCRLGQTARHVTVPMQHDRTKLPVEVLVGPLRKDKKVSKKRCTISSSFFQIRYLILHVCNMSFFIV